LGCGGRHFRLLTRGLGHAFEKKDAARVVAGGGGPHSTGAEPNNARIASRGDERGRAPRPGGPSARRSALNAISAPVE